MRVSGAELQSPGPGDPLEACRTALLRLHYNGVSPALWDAKLGLQVGNGDAATVQYMECTLYMEFCGCIRSAVAVCYLRLSSLLATDATACPPVGESGAHGKSCVP